MAELGPYYTHLTALNNLDGRTKEARILKAMRRELTDMLGHTPNAGELAMIERLAWLQLRIATLDRRLLDGKFTEFDASVYNAHVNSFGRGLEKLGVLGGGRRRAPPRSMSLTTAEILGRRVA